MDTKPQTYYTIKDVIMTDNKQIRPSLKYATLFIFIPVILLLVFYLPIGLFRGELGWGELFSTLGFLIMLIVPVFVILYPKKTDKIVKNISDKTEPINKKIDKFGDEVVVPAIGGFFMLCFRVLFVVACLYGLRALVRFLIY